MGLWSLVSDPWSLVSVSGLSSLVSGFWFLIFGLWSLVSGLWSSVSNLWSLVSGLWSLISHLVRSAYGSSYGLGIASTQKKSKNNKYDMLQLIHSHMGWYSVQGLVQEQSFGFVQHMVHHTV